MKEMRLRVHIHQNDVHMQKTYISEVVERGALQGFGLGFGEAEAYA
jgi:hypothetical protein